MRPRQRAQRSRPCPSRPRLSDGQIHLAAGLFGRAEAAVGQHRFHVLAGVARDGDLEIVNRGRAVHRERRGKSAAHQVEQHRREAALDDVPAHAPDDRLARFRARLSSASTTPRNESARQNLRQRIEQSGDAGRLCDTARAKSAVCTLPPRSAMRDSLQPREIERLVRGTCSRDLSLNPLSQRPSPAPAPV